MLTVSKLDHNIPALNQEVITVAFKEAKEAIENHKTRATSLVTELVGAVLNIVLYSTQLDPSLLSARC
jgi:hypothetical protein